MKCITRWSLLLLLVFATACHDGNSFGDPASIAGPSFALSLRPGFSFLPPVGTATSTAGFLGDLSPTVLVCKWNGGLAATTNTCDAGTLLAHFTRTSGTGNNLLRITDQNSYHLNWNTGTSLNPISATTVYQVVVLLGCVANGSNPCANTNVSPARVLGTANVQILANQGQAKNATGDVITLVDGRTLPISFGVRIEAVLDALGFQPDALASTDFTVESFTTTGGTQEAETPSGDAAFQVTTDGNDVQVPGGGTTFDVVVFERALVNGKCVAQYKGLQGGECYEYKTFPEGVTFYENGNTNAPIGIVGVCRAPGVDQRFELAKTENGSVTFPPPSLVNIVQCDGGLASRLPRPLRHVARLLLPAPLYAGDEGESGTVGVFSTVFWAAPIAVGANPSSANPSGTFGPGTVVPLSFRVMTTHDAGETLTPIPAAGVTVDFTVSTGGGTLSTLSAITDANGVVNVNWTLPATAGTHTVTAAVNGTGLPVTPSHSASATVMLLTTYSGLDAGAGPSNPRPNANAAAAQFDASAAQFGTVQVETFESAAVGDFSTLSLSGMTVTKSGTDPGAGIITGGDATLGYNTSSGGSRFLQVLPPFAITTVSVTFTPTVPLQAWGAYFTGVGTVPNTSVQVVFNDGTAQTFAVPGATTGGVSFFGFVDPGKSIASVTVTETLTSTSTRDIMGIDDVRIVSAAAALAQAGGAAVRAGPTVGRTPAAPQAPTGKALRNTDWREVRKN